MARDRDIPCAREARKSPFDPGFEGDMVRFLLGLGGEENARSSTWPEATPGRCQPRDGKRREDWLLRT